MTISVRDLCDPAFPLPEKPRAKKFDSLHMRAADGFSGLTGTLTTQFASGSTVSRLPTCLPPFGPDAGERREANARLIAAAPELLEALQQLFEHCAMVHKHWGEGDNSKQADAAISLAKAAIAKAVQP